MMQSAGLSAPRAPRAGTTRAAVIDAPRSARLVDVPVPAPGPGQVRVSLEGCGVCGSDLPLWEGRPWFHYPRDPGAPGHEGWGRIDALGEGVTGLAPGVRVTMLGYRSYAYCDIADAAHVVALPAQLDGAPVPGEPLGCACNVVCRAGITPGATVAVVGVGFLGAVVCALAAAAGARVIAITRRASGRALASRMGAAHVLAPGRTDQQTVEHVQELTSGELCDVAVEAGGAQATLSLAGPLVRTRGRLVVAGFHQDGPRTVDMQLWNWRGLDVINAHERDPAAYVAGMRMAVDAVAGGRIDPSPLYTHHFDLAQLDVALRTAGERPEGFMKALVSP